LKGFERFEYTECPENAENAENPQNPQNGRVNFDKISEIINNDARKAHLWHNQISTVSVQKSPVSPQMRPMYTIKYALII